MCFTVFWNEETPSQAIKTTSSKSRKIDIFSKGLTHGFSAKMAIFPTFFLAIEARKLCFAIFQNVKRPFQAIKTRGSTSQKIEIFPKVLTHGFGPKTAIFPTFFSAIQVRKMCFTIFQNVEASFQAMKTRSSKSRKIEIFSNGLTPCFGPKMDFFPTFFFNNIRKENVFYDILKRKDVFLGYENKKFRKLKNLAFSKGINQWFWCKNSHFLNFFLAIYARKLCFTIFQNEETSFQAIKTRSSESRKIEIFLKGF